MLWILEQIDTLEPERVLSLLPDISEERRIRVLSMTHEPSKVRSVLAELLLRHALRQEHGLTELPRVETGEKGKPFFPDRPELQFSLSHCQTAVACALDLTPVGVDAQEVRLLRRAARPLAAASDDAAPRKDGTLPSALPIFRILSGPERAWVEAGETPAERDRRFTAVWTCKEAWGKALGVGFLYDLRSTCFIPNAETWQQYDSLFFHLSRTDYELTLCSASALPVQTLSPTELMNAAEQRKPDNESEPL